MGTFAHFVTEITALAAGTLVSAAWQGALLAICAAVALRFWDGFTASARSYFWMSVMLVLAFLPFASLPARHISAVATASSRFTVDARWSLLLAAVWALLSLIRIAQILHSARYMRQIARRATRLQVGADVQKLLTVAGSKTATPLCSSTDIERPVLLGFFSPRILIPASLLPKLSPAELEQIALHEMEHLRRRDNWTNLFQKIATALMPLNPALLWVERRICFERELACDDGVIQMTRSSKAYATCLASLAEHRLVSRGLSLALGAWERRSELAKRIYRILERSGSRPICLIRSRIATTGLLLAVLGGGYELAHAPQLVTFTTKSPTAAATASVKPLIDSRPISQQVEARGAYTSPSIEAQDRPTLVKAVMPAQRPHAIKAADRNYKGAKRDGAVPNELVQRSLRRSAGWIVLTDWHQPSSPSRLTLTVTDFDPSFALPTDSYATIPTPDGWLIIHL